MSAAAQHAQGRLHASERIEVLCDDNSFAPIAAPAGAGVLAGPARVDGRPIWLFAEDATVAGGALTPADAGQICAVFDAACRCGAPVVGLIDTAGTRQQDGLAGLAALGAIQRHQQRAAGVVPRLAVVMGPCLGAGTSLAALADLRFMVAGTSGLLLSGADIAAAVANEIVGPQALGGAAVHAGQTGLADAVFDDEVATLLQVRHCLGFLPGARPTADPAARTAPLLQTLVPDDPARSYDITELLGQIADEGEFFMLQPGFAANVLCGFARLDGIAVGVLANQPAVLGGCLDAKALGKAARFVRLCDALALPLVTFVDTPGFVPGTAEEHGGIVGAAAALLAAMLSGTAAKLTVVVGKAYGGAYGVMAPKALGSDVVLAWSGADIALTGGGPSAGPAVARGGIDAVIAPAETRPQLCRALAARTPGVTAARCLQNS